MVCWSEGRRRRSVAFEGYETERTLLKRKLMLVVLAGLLMPPGVNAQSSATLIGLSEVYWRYVVDPSGEARFGYMPHCRPFGLMGAEDINSFRYPFFSSEIDRTALTLRRFGTTTATLVQHESRGLARATFGALPLPYCKNGEVWSG